MKITTRSLLLALSLSLFGCDALLGDGGVICPGEDPELYVGRTPTILEKDCRCATALEEPLCFQIGKAWDTLGELGAGPQPRLMKDDAKIWYGDLWEDRGEIIVPVALGANQPGFIMALNTKTGDRRIVSNRWVDYVTGDQIKGEGATFQRPTYALRGADGMIYVYAHGSDFSDGVDDNQINEIVRVDPDTGDRELVWRYAKEVDNGFGQCKPEGSDRSYQLALEGKGFDVTDKGTFLLTTIDTKAIIEISADGSSCRVVTSDDIPVGGGIDFSIAVEEVQESEGIIYAMTNNDILQVDPITGDRTRVAAVGMPGRLQYDPRLDVAHLTGIQAPYGNGIFAFDNSSGKFLTWTCSNNISTNDLIDPDHWSESCIDGGNSLLLLNHNQGWALPDGERFITVNANISFSVIDMKTGNSHHFSF